VGKAPLTPKGGTTKFINNYSTKFFKSKINNNNNLFTPIGIPPSGVRGLL